MNNPKIKPTVRVLLAHPAHFFALGCGLGLAPVAPGTFGTLGGFLLAWALLPLPLMGWIASLIVAYGVGCWMCDVTGKALGEPDHGGIVWDEVVAFAGVLLCVPLGWVSWIAAFVLFRFYDILKPWPIRVADARFKNGFGVMFDDLLAAVYAVVTYHALFALWQHFF